MSEVTCEPNHDWFTAALTSGLCFGLIVSYAPQHFRIIHKGSSEGFSPWFLLLGSTSSASGFLNMVAMQWSIVTCCRVVSPASCAEMTLGVVQVGLQWFLFSMIFVLYMIYYPSHLKYVQVDRSIDIPSRESAKKPIKRDEWRLSIILFWVTLAHILLITFTTFFLLLTTTPSLSPTPPLSHQVSLWATFLGVSSAILAAIQYAPQIAHTYRHKVVGALSIPMMCIQSPGAVLMVLSIALRPGTNWTSWVTFAVAGLMQGTLLVMCIIWKFRQKKLHLDDFGNPLPDPLTHEEEPRSIHQGYAEEVPGLVTSDDDDPAAVSRALAAALESAVEGDVRTSDVCEVRFVDEETPLLSASKDRDDKANKGWFDWFGR